MRTRLCLTNLLALVTVAAVGCGGHLAYNLPPAQQIMHPGPGVGGPGPGVIPVGNQMLGANGDASFYGPGGSTPGCGPMAGPGVCQTGPGAMPGMGLAQGDVQQVQYCEGGDCGPGGDCDGGAMGMSGPGSTSQIHFVGEEGLQIAWSVGGGGLFDSSPLIVPGRQDFPQGAIYRLKLSNIPGRPAVTLYPTLEVGVVTPRTDAYLAHAPIPVQFNEEDFDQVLSGNFVTKVIYLPDPEFQELALAGVETLVSTRLDPGCDPIAEADKRGSILAIVRIGNKRLETSGPTYEGGVLPAGYEGDEGATPAEYGEAPGLAPQGQQTQYCPDGSCGPGGAGGPGMGYGGAPMPAGMPTSGFAPHPVPPHQVAGAPQYGLPITGTPIGLPGPPHIPHGVPAGLQSHVMKNRTRVLLPGPTKKMTVSVKQRPGMNYPAPAHKVYVDETNRAPFKLFHGTLPGPLAALKAALSSHGSDCNCQECQECQ